MLSSDVDEAVRRTLAARGYTPANTLFGHSVCSDEVNAKAEQLVNLMVSRWGEGFTLGGLGGLPFAGKSGFRAYLHHAPDSGKLLIMFAPHVGIDSEGRVGALQREGQSALSKACGAALGAYKAIQSKGGAGKYKESAVKDLNARNEVKASDYKFDPELGSIINLLTPRLKGVELAPEPITFVTYQMYTIVRDLLDNCFTERSPKAGSLPLPLALLPAISLPSHHGEPAPSSPYPYRSPPPTPSPEPIPNPHPKLHRARRTCGNGSPRCRSWAAS